MDSILNSVKKILGLASDYDPFDQEIIMHINSVFSALNQEGIGPEYPFIITGSDEVWSDFIEDASDMEMVKTLVAMKVKMIFDPPASSTIVEAYNKTIGEYEWRLYSRNDYLGGTE